MNILEIFEIIRTKEYHADEDLIFFHNYEFEEFTQITKGYDFTESELNLFFKGEYFCVYLNELLDHTYLENDEQETIIEKMKENATH